MFRSRAIPILSCAALAVLWSSSHAAAGRYPSIQLISPATPAVETSQFSMTLQGSAVTENGLANVHWVNQFGKSGRGTWVENPQREASWTVPEIALRPGVNLLTVTVVDATNRSSSLHLVINRKASAASELPRSLQLGTGVYRNRPIEYQLWNGHAVVEGDIIVDLSTFSRPGGANTAAVKGAAVTPDGLAINYTSQLWPKVAGVYQVPYVQTGSSANATTAIAQFNSTFTGLIQFVPQTTQANYVNIITDAGGSGEGHSDVGMVGKEQTLECGGGCTVATWLHEMGHTVGLLHEHQRPDRAKYIKLTLANADLPNVPGNFTLIPFDSQTLGLYDYASVMHYGAFDFSKAGLPVLESIPAGIPLSNDSGYSAGDIDQVKRLYKATPSAVTVTTNPTGLQIVVDGVTYLAPQSFNFALNSTHTLALPADPQYTNPADGSTYIFGNWNDLGAASHGITIKRGSGTLTTPAKDPAVTMYEANYIRLQPIAFLSPEVYPGGSGTLAVSPAPIPEYGGSFFTDRTLVKLTLTVNTGYSFYDWFNLPYPPSDNPHSFYIQAPITQGQAVLEPSATPVTIVGETLTGTNKWNPGLVGYVDGAFRLLPSGFTPVYDAGWGAGTKHTVSVDQTQSPVTTNVYYNWNSWSDKGAITHTITQPATGHKSVTASLTPFYASYSLPPPLGGGNSSCAGGVATSPPGIVYPANTIFGFYEDGTSVTSTATPNPAFPAVVFAGWSGSITGSVNPDTTIVHDQFVPTASFNLIAAPIAVTSLTPASAAPSSSAAPAITIKGTGFTAGNTYTYWNGNYRPNSFVSSAEITMQLTAGDLATAGGQDVWVGNYTTNASNQTCGVGAETSFTVK